MIPIPPCGQNDWQIPVKTLPSETSLVGSNKKRIVITMYKLYNRKLKYLQIFQKKVQILSKFTGPAGPVNKQFTGPKQYVLACTLQTSAKCFSNKYKFC